MAFEYRHEPFRTLYVTYEYIVTILIRIPCWTLYYAVPALRPRPSWTIRRSLLVRLVRHASEARSKAGSKSRPWPNHTALVGPKAGDTSFAAVWIPPAPDLVVSGSILETHVNVAKTEFIRIPGYWLSNPRTPAAKTEELTGPALPGEKVVMHLHGGGYNALSAHPTSGPSNIPLSLLEHLPSSFAHRAFSVEYRLSVGEPYAPENPFPAALVDALAGYNYLVHEVGFAPQNIIVDGDSAGGNLAIALVRYLADHQDSTSKSVPALPGSLLLFSPWVDLSASHRIPSPENPISTLITNRQSDFLNTQPSAIEDSYGERAFVGPLGLANAGFNAYISPASFYLSELPSYKDFPPTFVSSGDAEVLLDQIRTFVKRMQEGGAKHLVYEETENAFHDFVAIPFVEPERTAVLNKISGWLQDTMSN